MTSRISMLRLYSSLRRQPGLGDLEIAFMAPECGIQETVTIQGEATVTHDDYVGGRLWEDVVCYSFYPSDLHHDTGGGIDTRPLEPGTVPTVPRGALVPRSESPPACGRAVPFQRPEGELRPARTGHLHGMRPGRCRARRPGNMREQGGDGCGYEPSLVSTERTRGACSKYTLKSCFFYGQTSSDF